MCACVCVREREGEGGGEKEGERNFVLIFSELLPSKSNNIPSASLVRFLSHS